MFKETCRGICKYFSLSRQEQKYQAYQGTEYMMIAELTGVDIVVAEASLA